MLKAEINKKRTEIELVGDLSDICADVSRILSAINEKLSEQDANVGHDFRMMFTTGFMDGICFDDDREHMEHYLAEGRQKLKFKKQPAPKTAQEYVDDFLTFLQEKLKEVEKFTGKKEEKEDETE